MICTCDMKDDSVPYHEEGCKLILSPHFFPKTKQGSLEKGTDTRLQTLEREFWERICVACISTSATLANPVTEICDSLVREWRKRFVEEEEPTTVPWKKRIANEP